MELVGIGADGVVVINANVRGWGGRGKGEDGCGILRREKVAHGCGFVEQGFCFFFGGYIISFFFFPSAGDAIFLM